MEQQPIGPGVSAALKKRDARQSIWRGFLGRCPKCGKGRLLNHYLKVVPTCECCGESYVAQRADDMPAYVTMLIVGHILIFGVAFVEDAWSPPMWMHLLIWLPLATLFTLLLLPRVKGSVVGLQWASRMHGFAGTQ